jgi:Intraflagellar transport complex B, subunit 20
VEREKISVIGGRNLLQTSAKNREMQLQQLSALIVEKQIQLDRCQSGQTLFFSVAEAATLKASLGLFLTNIHIHILLNSMPGTIRLAGERKN